MIHLTKNGDILCRESFYGTFFRSSPFAVLEAEYDFNRKYVLCEGDGSLALFYKLLDLEPPTDSLTVGWNYDYMAEEWETEWIDFIHHPGMTEDGEPYLDIHYPIPPFSLFYESCNPF